MRVGRPTQLIAYGKGRTGIKEDARYIHECAKRLQSIGVCGAMQGEGNMRKCGGRHEESEKVLHEFW